MQDLLSHLQALEVALHHPGTRCSRARLDELLHPDFTEVGRSGRTYDRVTVLDFLASQVTHAQVESAHFQLATLAPHVALLTYRSAHRQADGSLQLHTHRSSIWVEDAVGWRLRYHQGTPAAETW
jgi:hypothetical protein